MSNRYKILGMNMELLSSLIQNYEANPAFPY